MKIFYVHHANRKVKGKLSQDDTITRMGVKDAKNMADMFKVVKDKWNIKAIYTSPYYRCQKTTKIINKKLGLPVYEDARLNELDFHNEKWENCQKRIISLLKEIVYKYGEKDSVLCVTSGVNITAFIDVAFKIKPSSDLPYPLVFSCSPIGFDIYKENFD